MIRAHHCLIALAITVAACKNGESTPQSGPEKAAEKAASPAVSASAAPAAAASAAAPSADLYEAQTKWLRSYVEAYNKHDLTAIAKAYTEDAVLAELGEQGVESKGRANIQEDHKSIFEAFPDAKTTITRSWHIKDVVIAEFIEGGTNTADAEGRKATKKPYGMIGASIFWFTPEGLVKREQVYSDEMTMESQAGWLDPQLSKIEVRPLMQVPAFTGKWEQHKANGSADEGRVTTVREKLYSQFSMSTEKEFLAMLADDVTMAAYDDAKDALGKPAVGAQLKDWIKIFGEMKFNAELSWGCEEFALVQGVYSGKHVGAWGPIKPTKKTFQTHFLDISRITKDGKIDRMWTYASNSELLLHLGVRKVEKAAAPK